MCHGEIHLGLNDRSHVSQGFLCTQPQSPPLLLVSHQPVSPVYVPCLASVDFLPLLLQSRGLTVNAHSQARVLEICFGSCVNCLTVELGQVVEYYVFKGILK